MRKYYISNEYFKITSYANVMNEATLFKDTQNKQMKCTATC